MAIAGMAKTAYILTLVTLVLTLAAVRVSGHSLLVITGGSMEPTILKGSVVLVQPVDPSEVRLGDVTTFTLRGETVTHRVIRIEDTPEGPAVFTKGDANAVADPEPKIFAGSAGVVRLSVPAIGFAALYAQAYGRIVMVGMAALTLLASLVAMGRELAARRTASVQLRRLRMYCTVRAGRRSRSAA